MPFESNVFINCPFDNDYKLLLRPLLFTVLYLGYKPRLSQTQSSSDIRINQIKSFIRDSKFGIHDLSRCKPLKVGDLPRFNMPYELGLDIGCLEFGSRKLKTKKILILETERFHYQKVLSDIAGQDIENHDDDPRTLIRKVRNWFDSQRVRKSYPSPTEIWIAFNQFSADMNDELLGKYSQIDIDDMQVVEYLSFANDWIKSFKKSKKE
jgi:hypothetical protein